MICAFSHESWSPFSHLTEWFKYFENQPFVERTWYASCWPIKNGAVSLSPRNKQHAWGKDTRLGNYLESSWATVDLHGVFPQALWRQQRHAPSKPHRPHRWTRPVKPAGNSSNSLATDHQWTWQCLNKHSWVHEIKHSDPFFWPDCSLWTKMQRKIASMMMKRKALQPGWKGTDSTEDNHGCFTAKMNHLRITNKLSTFLRTNFQGFRQLHRSLGINQFHR